MADSFHQFPADGTGKRIRTYKRGGAADDPHDWYRIFHEDRITLARAHVCTFRTPGDGAANENAHTQNLLGVLVAAGSVAIAIRRLVVLLDVTAARVSEMGYIRCKTSTNVSGGTVLTPSLLDSNEALSGQVTWRGAASADGTNSTLSGVGDDTLWQQACFRMHTTTTTGAQVLSQLNFLLPRLIDETPVIVAPGEQLLMMFEGTNAGNRNTSHWLLNAEFEEFTWPR